MKKLFMLLALALGVASCQNEPEGLDVVVGGEQDVNITVSLPESTRGTSAEGFDLNNLGTLAHIVKISSASSILKGLRISLLVSNVIFIKIIPQFIHLFLVL